ncbi:MAG: aminopeptidase P family protein [Candidatus Aenigmatarchaeota archaeon]|nr:MAG: aminopeptidase P family protein [Candidatus Aenigmarchaeota archaeon]
MRLIGRKKVEEIRGKIVDSGLDAAVFVNNEPVMDSNIAYLSGFSGMLNGALILTPEGMELITTELDYDRAQNQAHVDDIFRCKHRLHLFQSIRHHCEKYKKIGAVKNKFTVEMMEKMNIPHAGLVDVSPFMERVRMVKEPQEIVVIRKGASICDSGVKFLEGFLRARVKENEIAAELERNMKIMGSERPPFDTIVTSGQRSMFIHPSPPASDTPVAQGLGLVDFGAVYREYSTDITVPFLFGRPSERQEQMIETISGVWEALGKKIRAGVKTNTLHDIYEKKLKAANFRIKHSLGHSVGLEVHEYPSLSGTEAELREGMVLAIEPGVYDKKAGGCRLENIVLVKKNGCEMLTKSKLIRM